MPVFFDQRNGFSQGTLQGNFKPRSTYGRATRKTEPSSLFTYGEASEAYKQAPFSPVGNRVKTH